MPQVVSKKPKLNLPGSTPKSAAKAKRKEILSSSKRHPLPPQMTPASIVSGRIPQQAAHCVDKTAPVLLNSVKETLPVDLVVHGVGATKIAGNSSLPTSLSHPVEYIRQLEIIHEDESLRDALTCWKFIEVVHRATCQALTEEPSSSFEMALSATECDLRLLFAMPESDPARGKCIARGPCSHRQAQPPNTEAANCP